METEVKKAKLEEIVISAKNMIIGLANSEGITDVSMIIAITASDFGTILLDGNPREVLKGAARVVSSVTDHLLQKADEQANENGGDE
jgi:hypothetical protein